MACPPAPVIERPVPTPTPTRALAVDTVVVGAGPLGAAAAWQLARRGRRVLLVERCTPAQVWRSEGALWWAAGADIAASGLWRELQHETGAALLQVPGPRVRAAEASAALTAAAVGRGALLRPGDAVRAVTVTADGVLVRTRECVTTARRVVLVGAGPGGLAPAQPGPGGSAAVVTAPGARSFGVPLLGAALAELVL